MSRFILVPQHSCVSAPWQKITALLRWLLACKHCVRRGQTPPCLCRHLHCNSAMFLSMKLEAASWLRKVFSYEAHSGEVSETSSQCSKLNLVPFGKSAKTVLLLRNTLRRTREKTCRGKNVIVILSACILVDLLPHFERLHGQYHLFSG